MKRQVGFAYRPNKPVNTCNEEEILHIRSLIEQHGVVCIKDQHVDGDDLLKFCSMLGNPMNLPEGLAFYNQENTWITRIGNIKKDGSIIPNQKASMYWHSDGDITQAPGHYIYIMLNAKVVPPVGGRTGFLDMRTLTEEASPEVHEWFKDATIEVKVADIQDFGKCKEAHEMGEVKHLLNQVHPLRGIQQFYLCAHDGYITFNTGEKVETPHIMEKVFNEKYMYVHQYEVGDLVIWDDIQMHHKSMGGFGDHPRLLFRAQAQVVDDLKKLQDYMKNHFESKHAEYLAKTAEVADTVVATVEVTKAFDEMLGLKDGGKAVENINLHEVAAGSTTSEEKPC